MRFSKSILFDKSIGTNLFNGMVDKTNKFIKDVYDIDVNSNDARIRSINADDNNYRYGMIINYGERNIGIGCSFEKEENRDDTFSEVLHIVEVYNESVSIPESKCKDSYNKLVDSTQTYLENRYGLNFTPIDPETNDPNIIDVEENENQYIWKALFAQAHHEGRYEVQMSGDPKVGACIKVIANKRHKIYLD